MLALVAEFKDPFVENNQRNLVVDLHWLLNELGSDLLAFLALEIK